MQPTPAWVDEAAGLPVAFAQVREDARLDREVVDGLGGAARVLMIASGGCTAAALAASGRVSFLHLVDVNPAQLALTRVKLRLLATTVPSRRLALLGHAPMPAGERREALAAVLAVVGLPTNALGPNEVVADLGPDRAGRYERVFAELARELAPVLPDLEAVLRLRDPAAQSAGAAPDTALGRALDAAYDRVLALPNLVRLFGEQATRNPAEPFPRHFARRTRDALATLPAADNPYLWQMLRGRFPDGCVYLWLRMPPSALPEVAWTAAPMAAALADSRGDYDFVHLSNILDWLSPDEARATLAAAARALRPGGVVLVRQLNSTVDVPAAGAEFVWDDARATTLHARDRSFFYRALHLGRRR